MIAKTLLLVVDVQKGFVSTPETENIVAAINTLVKRWKAQKAAIVFSKFINRADSSWVRFIGWNKMHDVPETDFANNLRTDYGEVYEKTAYSAWSHEVEQICHAQGVDTVAICGIDTDQCMLANEAGIKLLTRLIGVGQMVNSSKLDA
jgi:nicotinamidase-related amidase